MTIAIDTKLGRYEIHSLIGAGGMGEVYLAEDTKLDRKVALKILPESAAHIVFHHLTKAAANSARGGKSPKNSVP